MGVGQIENGQAAELFSGVTEKTAKSRIDLEISPFEGDGVHPGIGVFEDRTEQLFAFSRRVGRQTRFQGGPPGREYAPGRGPVGRPFRPSPETPLSRTANRNGFFALTIHRLTLFRNFSANNATCYNLSGKMVCQPFSEKPDTGGRGEKRQNETALQEKNLKRLGMEVGTAAGR
jgi:hypothetical protein